MCHINEVHYRGQRSPVHAGTADVDVLPVHNPEGGQQLPIGQDSHVQVVDIRTCQDKSLTAYSNRGWIRLLIRPT